MKPAASAPGAVRGYASIVLANLLFTIGFSFIAAIDSAMSVWQLVLLRGVVFTLALLPWAVRHPDVAKGSNRGLLILRGGLGTAMVLCLLFAIGVLPLSMATLMGKTTPLWELLMLWLLLALRPYLSELLLIPVAILGLVLILLAATFCLFSVAGQSLLTEGMHHVSPTFASVGTLLVPVFATVIEWVVFDQQLSGLELIGIALVLAPSALIARAEGKHSAALAATTFRWQRAGAGDA
jgi:drug/metabolite transporter (DMT)-like permease